MKKFKIKNFKLKAIILSLALTMFLGGGIISLIFANQNKNDDMKVTGVVDYIGSIYSDGSFDRAGLLNLKRAVDAGPNCFLGGSSNVTSVRINGDDYLVAYVSSGFVEGSNKAILNTEDTIVTLFQRYSSSSWEYGYNNSYDQSNIRNVILSLGSSRIGIPEEYIVGAGKLWWQRSYISRIDIDSEVYARRAIERKNDFIQVFGSYDFPLDDEIELPNWSMYDYHANGWEGDMYWIPSFTEIEDIWTDQTEESASWVSKTLLGYGYWLRTGTIKSDLDADNDGDGLVDFDDQYAYLVQDLGNVIGKTVISDTGYAKLCFNLNLTKALATESSESYSDWRAYASEYFAEGIGNEYDPYLIYSAEDLALLSKLASDPNSSGIASCSFKQMEDIDLIGTPWYPILNFQGIYDGNGYTIYNMECTPSVNCYIDYPSGYYNSYYVNGLFGYCSNAVLNNISLELGSAGGYGEQASTCVGGIVGLAIKSEITNCKNISGSVNGYTAGGIVGEMNEGSIENCINDAAITGDGTYGGESMAAGGIAGDVTTAYTPAVVKNCINRGFVMGNGYLGGICGTHEGDDITFCFNYGSLVADISFDVPTYIGGICGYARDTGIFKCIVGDKNINVSLSGSTYMAGFLGFSDGNVRIKNCIANNVSIYGTGEYVDIDSFCAYINDAYSDTTICENCAFIGDISFVDNEPVGDFYIPFRQNTNQYQMYTCYCAINYTRIGPDEYMIDQAYVQKQYKLYSPSFDDGYFGIVEDFNFGMMINDEFIPMPIPKDLFWIADFTEESSFSYLEQHGFTPAYDQYEYV